MAYYEIEFPLAGRDSDALEETLAALGALSITFVDRGDEPVLEPAPGEIRLWSDTLVRALFDAPQDHHALQRAASEHLAQLAARFGEEYTAHARIRPVEERVWERAWMDGWQPRRFGDRLWVCPTWAQPPSQADAVVVWLDPGLAFGTGTHPTTALCLETLDRLPVAGRTVIDYGCGSGILGIAALKLGAHHVTAVDLDHQALLATRSNAQRNAVAAALQTRGVEEPLQAADIVLANILAGPLLQLRPTLTAACRSGGDLVLSGILASQVDAVQAAYHEGFEQVSHVQRDDWCCIHARGAA